MEYVNKEPYLILDCRTACSQKTIRACAKKVTASLNHVYPDLEVAVLSDICDLCSQDLPKVVSEFSRFLSSSRMFSIQADDSADVNEIDNRCSLCFFSVKLTLVIYCCRCMKRGQQLFILVWYLVSFSPKSVTVLKNCLEKKVLTSTFLLNMCDAACVHTLYGSHHDNQMHMSLAPLHFIQLITYSVKRKIACSSAHTIQKCSK